MGATDATILSPDGSGPANGSSNNSHCSHTCSIVLFCTIVPFCVLSILFLIVYATCGHRYIDRKRKAKLQQDVEVRKLGDADSMLNRDSGYSRGEDGLALGWGPLRDVEAAPAPPPTMRDRPGEERVKVGSRP